MTGIHQWVAVHLEPLVLGLAIALLVVVTLALVERPCKYSESVVLSPREPIRRRHNVGRSRLQHRGRVESMDGARRVVRPLFPARTHGA